MVANALFYFDGQSNNEGRGVAASVTNFTNFAVAEPAIPTIRWTGLGGDPPTGLTREPAVSGTGSMQARTTSAGGSFVIGTNGPEIGCCKTLHADSTLAGRVRCLTMGLDGADLTRFLPATAFPAGSTPGLDNWFTLLVSRLKAAQTDMQASLRLGGMCFEQGTSDALSSTFANAYYVNLTTFFNALWNALNCKFPVVLGRISSVFVANFAGAAANGNTVRAAQMQWCGDNGFEWLNNDDLTDIGDFAHYDSNSQAELGRRYALAHLRRRQRMDMRR